MASISTITTSSFLSLQAISRPKSPKSNPIPSKASPRNPNSNRNRKLKPQKAKFKSPPQTITSTAGEATSYTCLPPLEDFTVPSLNLGSRPPEEIKLSDANVVKQDSDSESQRFGTEDGMDGDLRVDYGRFEVNTHFEEEEEEDADYEYESEEEEEEEEETVNGKSVNSYNSDGFYEGEELGEFADGENVSLSDFEGEEEGVKEKGVPAVMRCFDRAKIYVKAGDGGNGVVAFRREKFVPLGGPSGGDGGRGGNVYLEVDGSINSLLPFRNRVHYRAGRGSHGQGSCMGGAKGEEIVVKVPPGTVVREAGNEEVLLELLSPGQRALVLPGGRGGRGNAAFKCGSNKVPRIAENGEEGSEMLVYF